MENPLADIDQIEQIADPAERAREIGRRLAAIPAYQERLRKMRQAAVLEMRAQHLSFGQIGKEIGLHRNRAQQIAEGRTAGGRGGGSPVRPSASTEGLVTEQFKEAP